MKRLLLIGLGLILSLWAIGQRAGGRPGGGDRPNIIIKGNILDSESGAPLEFATISLFSQQDSSLVGGGMTDLDGVFEISAPIGRYYGVAEFIGYSNLPIDIVIDRDQIRSGNRTIDLGTLSMAAGGIQLEGVEVVAERSETVMKLDKRVFNVGQDLANRGGSAEDILDNVPSVTVDIDGNVSLRGSGGVRILINGRPSGLAGADNTNGLRAIPSNMIERVEVITNPSARYEAEGMAGIINIILKKEASGGFNGSFDINGGYPATGGVGANVNYRKGDINWFANYGLRYNTNYGGGESYTETYSGDNTFYQDQFSDRDRTGLSNSFRAGMDYFFNDKENLTGAFLYRLSDEDNFNTIDYLDYTDLYPSNLTRTTLRTDDEREEESNLEYSLNYRKEFSKRGHELTATVQYRDEIETEGSDFLETATSTIGEVIPDLNQRSNNEEGEKTWLFQVDFAKPIGEEGTFELGARSSLRNISNDYLVEEQIGEIWTPLEGLSNNFNYDENIHATYAIFGNKMGKFGFQLGLRGEYSEVLTELIQTNEINDRDYFNLFPSGHFNYEFSEGNSMQVSYSRRMRRPRFWDLNPFFTFSDSRNTFSGNPNLDPELTDSYEVAYIKYFNTITLTSSVYYRKTNGAIERILEFSEDGTTNRIPQNLATRQNAGAEFIFSYSGVDWLRLDGNVNAFYTATDGGNIDESLDASDFTWFGRMTSRISFWDGADLQLRFNYRAGVNTTQGRRNPIGTMDIGMSKDIASNATMTFSVRDVFNSRRRNSETFGENFFRTSEFQWRARTINLAFNYRINQKKQRQRGERGDYEGGEGEF